MNARPTLDKRFIGSQLTPFSVQVERGRLRTFALATGQADPVYSDEAVARRAGHPSLPVPPTFLFCLEMGGPDPLEVYKRLGIDYARVLHGEQHFTWHRLAFAGETLHFKPRIADLYERKQGALQFLVWETRVEAGDRSPVADLRSVMVACDPVRAGRLQPGPIAKPALAHADSGDCNEGSPVSMKVGDFDSVQVGDALPALVEGPITRHTLGLYAGASGDYNPLHLDIDFARRVGMPDVFAHGMLSMAYLGRALTDWVDQASIRSMSARFTAITHIGDEVRCQARVAGKFIEDGEKRATLRLNACNAHGDRRLTGSAVVALS